MRTRTCLCRSSNKIGFDKGGILISRRHPILRPKRGGKKIELVFIVTFPFSSLPGRVFSLENFEGFR
ncbi:hypothetical protein A0128_10895 [Leptospira tipperaryensis]|uniref:Uncharacterized protein n=1 Tax=Leptospira tipperaryensis TaxID=2564040 RepID=A0A1D7UXI9_9LEPT|nr:hypothetical protein A0128_10895 [Leptospira tipperaryensis]